jgi:hypothetical protein
MTSHLLPSHDTAAAAPQQLSGDGRRDQRRLQPVGPNWPILEHWALKNGSYCRAGEDPQECFASGSWESLGVFFPGTGDARCNGTSCGAGCPAFVDGRHLSGGAKSVVCPPLSIYR